MPNHSPLSARMSFQWKWFEHATPSLDGKPTVLNVGCADDPLQFGNKAMHFDIDDWSYRHEFFTQGDAHELPFPDQSYDVVILGDIIEHAFQPHVMLEEAARVCSRLLAMTIFEEWKLLGDGQHIENAWEVADAESQELGFADRLAYQAEMFPQKIEFDDSKMPHLFHINQLTDQDIDILMLMVVDMGFVIREYRKQFEITYAKDKHRIHNWLACLERIGTQ